jgi:hypothetical protein
MTMARWPRYAAAAVGFAWYLHLGGAQTLDPRNVAWVMAGDWLQHWLGWLFFRNDPWTFPLGRISSLLYPVGTNIGFTDSNPLVSLTLKPFSPLLPRYMQFIGPWLAACFTLQGYAGAALSGAVTPRRWQQFLGGCLFVMSPVLAARVGHDTLCAHFLILGLLYLGLRECPDAATARRSAWTAMAAVALSAAIHPYLAVTCWVLAQAVIARLWRTTHLGLPRAALVSVATTAAVLAIFGSIGYFGSAQLGSIGFGYYSANLLALVNPMGFSRTLPSAEIVASQWEGFGFLGAGGLVLVALSTVVLAWRRPSRGRAVWPVVTVVALMAAYSVSTVITFGTRAVLRFDSLTPFFTPFRASGRFIWAFHYLLLLFGIWGATRAFGRSRRAQAVAVGVLAAAVVVQAADFQMDPYWLSQKNFKPVPIANLRIAVGHYRHVVLVPMRVHDVCGEDREDHVYRYMYLAYRLGSTYNSGIFARLSRDTVSAACQHQEEEIAEGRLDPGTIYVADADAVAPLQKAGAACGRFGEPWVCVSRDSDAAFGRYLEENGRPSSDR